MVEMLATGHSLQDVLHQEVHHGRYCQGIHPSWWEGKTFIKNHPLVTDVQASEQAEEQAQEQAAEQVEEQQIEFPSVIPVKFTIPNGVSTGSITYTLNEIAHGIVDNISFSPDNALKPGFKYAMVTLLTENVEQGTTGFKLIKCFLKTRIS